MDRFPAGKLAGPRPASSLLGVAKILFYLHLIRWARRRLKAELEPRG
jgi:hypothetical protein